MARSKPTAAPWPSISSPSRRSTSRPSTSAPTTGRAIDVAGTPAPDAFVRGGEGTRVATVSASLGGVLVEAGVEDLIVMKTGRSAFSGFPRDRYTTLPETDDRLMATKLTAIWRYGSPDLDFDATFAAVRATLLEVFADHDSPSVQDLDLDHGPGDPRASRGDRARSGWSCPTSTTGWSTCRRSGSRTTARSSPRPPSRTA